MAEGELPTPEELRQLLRYEPETGKLYWLERPLEMFSDERYCKAWNTRYAGKEALTGRSKGYCCGVFFNGKKTSAHRVIWAMVHGEWPQHMIDHINGVRDDNRIENLRSVTFIENLQNAARRSDNISGRTGVSWNKADRKWWTRITVENRTIWLGAFERFEDAVAAREEAEIEHGFHPNHGRDR